jgi:hypothetical protein
VNLVIEGPIEALRLALLVAVEHLMEAGQPDDLEVFLNRVADALDLGWCDPRLEKWRLIWRLARDRK